MGRGAARPAVRLPIQTSGAGVTDERVLRLRLILELLESRSVRIVRRNRSVFDRKDAVYWTSEGDVLCITDDEAGFGPLRWVRFADGSQLNNADAPEAMTYRPSVQVQNEIWHRPL